MELKVKFAGLEHIFFEDKLNAGIKGTKKNEEYIKLLQATNHNISTTPQEMPPPQPANPNTNQQKTYGNHNTNTAGNASESIAAAAAAAANNIEKVENDISNKIKNMNVSQDSKDTKGKNVKDSQKSEEDDEDEEEERQFQEFAAKQVPRVKEYM